MGGERKSFPWGYSAKVKYAIRMMRDRRLNPSALAVGSVLIDHANRKSGKCFLKVATIVDESGVPRSTALRSLQALESTGWIETDKRFGAVSNYQLTGPEDGTGPTVGTGANLNLRRGGTGPDGETNRSHGRDTEQGLEQEDQEQQERAALRASPPIFGSKGQTFEEWLDGRPEGVSMDDLLTDGDRYAEAVGLPMGEDAEVDFTVLAWERFRILHLPATDQRRAKLADAGSASRKRSTDWPGEYRKAIENCAGGLWAFNREDRAPYLTTKGRQFALACGLLTTKP